MPAASPPVGSRDFTLAKYGALCVALREAGYRSVTLGDYLSGAADVSLPRIVLLRHDVESSPAHALRMAAVESGHGLAATYFFRTKRGVFRPEAIRRITAMGHEIGYHYETVSQARGDLDRAVSLFARQLARLREHAPIRVASMHGSPLWPWDNRAIWTRASPADFGLVGEVYRDLDYRSVHTSATPAGPGTPRATTCATVLRRTPGTSSRRPIS